MARGEAIGEQVRRRDPEGDPAEPDLAFGPDQALCHGLAGNQEGARYLVDAVPYNKVRGLPFTAAELENMLEDVVKNG